MEKVETLYAICLDNKNIHFLIKKICEDFNLSERSIPRCVSLIKEITKENINNLTRLPRNSSELSIIVAHLNKLCINRIISIILKKYPQQQQQIPAQSSSSSSSSSLPSSQFKYPPNQQINNKIRSKEQLKRNLDVYGDRANTVQDRSYITTKKDYIDESDSGEDDEFHAKVPNDIGYGGFNESTGYASINDNYSITQLPLPSKQSPNNNRNNYNNINVSGDKKSSNFEERMNDLVNKRNYDIRNPQRPTTPDFTLDGTGDKVRREKMMRRVDSTMGTNDMAGMSDMPGMSGMPGMPGMPGMNFLGEMGGVQGMNSGGGGQGMADFGLNDDFYASLLGGGAPASMQTPMQTPMQNTAGPGIGMGNPMMPMSSTSILSDQMNRSAQANYGMSGGYAPEINNQSVKAMGFLSDYEKKMAERRDIDQETGQPESQDTQSSTSYNYQPQMPTYQPQMPTYQQQMPTYQQQMPTYQPQMPTYQMPNYQSQAQPQQRDTWMFDLIK